MKTILDDLFEVSLEKLVDEDVFLTCYVLPMTAGKHNKIFPDVTKNGIKIVFNHVVGYILLPEIVQIGMNFEYKDDFVLTQVVDNKAISFFGFDKYFPNDEIKHITIRTSHCFLNVFVDNFPEILEQ